MAISVYRYRTFVGPLLLIGLGVIALLANFGYLNEEALFRVGQLWPLILILIGAALVVNRFAAPVAATTINLALAGLALVAVVAYAALGPSGVLVGIDHQDVSSPAETLKSGELNIGAGAARLEVRGGPTSGDLYRGQLDFPRGEKPRVSFDRESGRVSIEGGQGFHFLGLGAQRRHVDLTLSDHVPWRIEVGGGANSANLDLRTLQLTAIDVSGGATRADLRLPAPKGALPIQVSGGANNVTLHVPAGAAVRVEASGGANNVSVFGHRVNAFGGDSSYQTDGYSSAGDRYEIRLSGGASNVRVE